MSSQSSTQTGKSIFISYRRKDSSAITGRIYDRLIQKFSPESIFKDVDSIPFGEDFPEHPDQQVVGCKVLLAIVGEHWAGDERLQSEDDFVRVEIEYGLDPGRDIRLIPVLVEDASMPSPDQLPDSLKNFTRKNAIQVRNDPDFHKDMDKLIKSLAGIVEEGLAPTKPVSATAVLTHTPYRIRGREFHEPRELAVYLSENWAEGVKHFGGGMITDWVKADYRDQGLAIDLADIVGDEELDGDQKLSVALLVMNSELPVFWCGNLITLHWLAENPGEAVKILESSLPDWYARLRGDRILVEARDARLAWRESVSTLDVPVDWARVDELALQDEEEREARFKAFWQKFESGEYGGIKNAQLQAALDRGAPDDVEQVALLCCDEELFLTPQEKYHLDSIEFLKGFGVQMDWELAEKLIASNSWETINPLWLEVRSAPLHPSLAGNQKIDAIHRAQEAQYLDVVAMVAADQAEKDKGTPIWEFETGDRVTSSPAIGSDGTVYVGSVDKKLYAINPKSRVKLWEFETGGDVYSSPAIGPDGTVYVGSYGKKLYAIKTGSPGPANSPWPMRGQNAQHTGRVMKK